MYYEKSTDRIAVNASEAPLEKVIEFIFKNVGIKIDTQDKELLQTQISTELPLQPLEEALRALLEDFNTLFLYSAADDLTLKAHRPVLAGVKIVSKKKEGASETAIVRLGNVPDYSDQQAGRNATDRQELDRLLNALKQPRSETEKQQIVESLLVLLADAPDKRDHQAFSDILSHLKDHAPYRAVEPLISLLGQPETNRVFRAMAARTLGEIGDEMAVDPLIQAFHDSDPLVQANAATSLARLRSARGLDALLQVFKGDNQLLQQSVANTLAVSGTSQANQALKQMIAAGQVGRGVVSKDAMSILDGKN